MERLCRPSALPRGIRFLRCWRTRSSTGRDRLWMRRGGRLGELVRYSDDLVILCRTEAQARDAHRQLEAILERLGLRLNPQKTRLLQLTAGREGFDFLGFHPHKTGRAR